MPIILLTVGDGWSGEGFHFKVELGNPISYILHSTRRQSLNFYQTYEKSQALAIPCLKTRMHALSLILPIVDGISLDFYNGFQCLPLHCWGLWRTESNLKFKIL